MQRLEMAWFSWQATSLAAGQDQKISWKFDCTGFDATLLEYGDILRHQHRSDVVRHIADCSICHQGLALILDGKVAGRRVCANTHGYWRVPELDVQLSSGCQKHCSPDRLYCKTCQPKPVRCLLRASTREVSSQTCAANFVLASLVVSPL